MKKNIVHYFFSYIHRKCVRILSIAKVNVREILGRECEMHSVFFGNKPMYMIVVIFILKSWDSSSYHGGHLWYFVFSKWAMGFIHFSASINRPFYFLQENTHLNSLILFFLSLPFLSYIFFYNILGIVTPFKGYLTSFWDPQAILRSSCYIPGGLHNTLWISP